MEAEIPPTWCAASGACRSRGEKGSRVQAALESLHLWGNSGPGRLHETRERCGYLAALLQM